MPDNNLLTPFAGNPKFPLLRAYLQVSDADLRKFDSLPRGQSDETASVFDTVSQEHYELRRVSCGGSCYCAAEIVGT